MLTYCTHCVMPSTKPDLHFSPTGVCNACTNYLDRERVDWQQRDRDLKRLLQEYRCPSGTNWDCIVPVSGGKDSTCQVLRLLQLGMTPLCVTATTCDLSDLGRKNLDNLRALGVDLIEVSGNPKVRAKLNRIGLLEVGDISWPEHVSIFTTPVRLAVQLGVSLIVYGENPQNEYGGPAASTQEKFMTRRWLEEFGGLLGLRVSDLIGMEGLRPADLIQYTYPSDEELRRVGVTALFLGYFAPWDGYTNALIAQGYGFTTYPKAVEGSIVNYENLDNYQTGIHDYFKFLKFGFGRATDLACMHIRRGRLSREQGLQLVKMHDCNFPWMYLGKPLQDILAPLEMSVDEFVAICDRFTNKRIFQLDSTGQLLKDRQGNLKKLNDDNL
ncbi:N-acetyl sugar amidotransferase [bacterium]|nr:N-acetyl sugar amidotransferase [bacterium]